VNIEALIETINVIFLAVFVFLTGGLVAALARRLYLYRAAKWPVPILLKRNLIFFGGFGALILESILLRVVGGDLFTGPTLLRLLYIAHYDVIATALFAYYLKVEVTDIDDPKKD
jgi:hypothetical protein